MRVATLLGCAALVLQSGSGSYVFGPSKPKASSTTRTVVIVADSASTVTELSRLAGAFDEEASQDSTAPNKLVAELSKGSKQQAVAPSASFQQLTALSSSLGREAIACVQDRCPRLYNRATRVEAKGADTKRLVAVELRQQNKVGAAAAALEALRWAKRAGSWRVYLTTEMELTGEAASVFSAVRYGRGLQQVGNSTGGSGISMSPDVLMMLIVVLGGALAVAGMASCTMQIPTPSRFAHKPLRPGKTF